MVSGVARSQITRLWARMASRFNRIEHSAAAGADNVMLLGTDFPHDALFDAAKVRFALGLKKLRYPLLFLLLDFAIGIAEPPVQLPCQDSADGGFSRAR